MPTEVAVAVAVLTALTCLHRVPPASVAQTFARAEVLRLLGETKADEGDEGDEGSAAEADGEAGPMPGPVRTKGLGAKLRAAALRQQQQQRQQEQELEEMNACDVQQENTEHVGGSVAPEEKDEGRSQVLPSPGVPCSVPSAPLSSASCVASSLSSSWPSSSCPTSATYPPASIAVIQASFTTTITSYPSPSSTSFPSTHATPSMMDDPDQVSPLRRCPWEWQAHTKGPQLLRRNAWLGELRSPGDRLTWRKRVEPTLS